jgi:TonB-linked SusC/RagA family outer membrane protein
MNNFYKIQSAEFLKTTIRKSVLIKFLLMLMLAWSSAIVAQNMPIIKGRIVDEKGEPLIGATVKIKGLNISGALTNANGQFSLNMPEDRQVIMISYIGYETQEVNIKGKASVTVVMKDNSTQMGEVVIVGFGQQKKASVVGSIAQTTGKVLERAGGVSSVGAALTGNLPGVTTLQSSSKPGEEDPQIIIRGISSWNNSNPLVLVDGIERAMSSVDINSVETISVLKDASATAVYGVRGANGVILINTKRGAEGKAKIEVGFSSTMKNPSKLPGKYDAYDALEIKNRIVEYELNSVPNGWSYIRPQSFIAMYRNQTTQDQRERYPNIDWQKIMFKDFAMSYNANVNVTGGTKNVKYFAAMDYQHEGDIVNITPNGRGYSSGYAYDRVNTRANLDFDITKSTKFKVNLFGSYGSKKSPYTTSSEGYLWAGAYGLPADVYYPRYSDGSWGYLPASQVNAPNSLAAMSMSGYQQVATTRLTTDFALNQDLGMFLKGLSAKITISLDNTFQETASTGYNNNTRGINDAGNNYQQKYIDPLTGAVTVMNTNDATTNFDYYQSILWTAQGGSLDNSQTARNANYQAQILYGARFGDHNVTAMGNVQRNEYAISNNLTSYREDWVFRGTYNFKEKYFLEMNGAYNGSDKFAPANRFGFFSSGALGWMLSEEKFMKSLTFLDMLKLRTSYGQIGDDGTTSARWLYMDQWTNGTTQSELTGTYNANNNELSPYQWHTQTQIGNSNIGWEKVTKKNIGADFSFFNNLIAGNVDFFNDHRTNIIMAGSSRAIPPYLGFSAPSANVGEASVHGYELELRFSKMLSKNVRLWANVNMTHAVDKVINKDDPALLAAYLKKAGFSNNQVTSTISHGYYNTWDELYGSTAFDVSDAKIPGNYRIVDFNADGVINSTTDKAPYGYPTNPQNTYNTTIGVDWKGFSAFIQFYGVNNVSRYVGVTSFGLNYMDVAYQEGSYWSKNNKTADSPNPRVNNTSLNDASWGTRYMYDGSYIRLKNAEVSYTFDSKAVKSIGLQSVRIFLNGNNLFLWTKTPDDREVNNYNGNSYPNMKRFNLGLKVTL